MSRRSSTLRTQFRRRMYQVNKCFMFLEFILFTIEGYRDDVKLVSFWDTVSLGRKNAINNNDGINTDPVAPTPESPCIIMYTSGTRI